MLPVESPSHIEYLVPPVVSLVPINMKWTLNASAVSARDQILSGSPPPSPHACALKREEGESLGTRLTCGGNRVGRKCGQGCVSLTDFEGEGVGTTVLCPVLHLQRWIYGPLILYATYEWKMGVADPSCSHIHPATVIRRSSHRFGNLSLLIPTSTNCCLTSFKSSPWPLELIFDPDCWWEYSHWYSVWPSANPLPPRIISTN